MKSSSKHLPEVMLLSEKHLTERYQYYRQGEISFGRLAEDLGITTWASSHLLEERGWPTHNLPEVSK